MNIEISEDSESHIIEINTDENEIIDIDKIKKEELLLPLFKFYFNSKHYNQFIWKEVYNTYFIFKIFNSYFFVLFYLIFNCFYFTYKFINNTNFSLYIIHAIFCFLNIPLIYNNDPSKLTFFNFYYIVCLIFILSSNGTFFYNFLFGIILINLHKNIIKNCIISYNNQINNNN